MSNIPRHLAHSPADEDARAANTALIGELKEQVQKAENVSEEYRKQLGVVQMKLDEAVTEQSRLDDLSHEKDGSVTTLQAEVRDLSRQLRDVEQAHETERNAMLKDKESQGNREEELQSTIQRLKETIAQKDIRMTVENDRNLSRSRKSLVFQYHPVFIEC